MVRTIPWEAMGHSVKSDFSADGPLAGSAAHAHLARVVQSIGDPAVVGVPLM